METHIAISWSLMNQDSELALTNIYIADLHLQYDL